MHKMVEQYGFALAFNVVEKTYKLSKSDRDALRILRKKLSEAFEVQTLKGTGTHASANKTQISEGFPQRGGMIGNEDDGDDDAAGFSSLGGDDIFAQTPKLEKQFVNPHVNELNDV
jgi:hypothetical protein